MSAAVKSVAPAAQSSVASMIRRRMSLVSRCWTAAQRRRRAIEAAIMQRRLFGALLRPSA